MKKIAIFLVLMILLSGCLEKKVVKYVCPDKSVVSDSENCPELEPLAPEKIIVIKYVCPGGEVVDKADGCEIEEEEELGTTTTIPMTTTTLKETTTSTTLISTSTTTTSTITSTSTTTTTIQETDACTELGCPAGTEFVGSTGGTKYHYCDCHYVNNINPENLICFKSKEDAQSEGYTPCGVCKPPE